MTRGNDTILIYYVSGPHFVKQVTKLQKSLVSYAVVISVPLLRDAAELNYEVTETLSQYIPYCQGSGSKVHSLKIFLIHFKTL